MSDSQEIDGGALQQQLDQIKDAMGIREGSPGGIRIWLLFGVLVPLAGALYFVYAIGTDTVLSRGDTDE